MSYDLSFRRRPATLVDRDRLAAWFSARPYWTWEDDRADFSNPHSGTEFRIRVGYVDEDMPEEERPSLTLSMSGDAAHLAGPELVREVSAFASDLGLLVDDPQSSAEGAAELDAEKLLAGWQNYVAFVTKTNHTLFNRDLPPHLPAERFERTVAWNIDKSNRENDDSVFVPKIMYAVGAGSAAETFVSWVGGDGMLPIVDSLVTPLGRVAWSAVAPALATAPLVNEPAPHYQVTGALAAAVQAAIDGAPRLGMPTLIEVGALRTTEILEPYLAGDGGLSTADAQTAESIAVMAHQSDDSARAFAAGKRAFALDPTSKNGALVAAINGYYLGELDESLRLADAVVQLDPENDTAHTVRAGVLTDLARYDEAVSACDRALAIEASAMVENMKGYALAAAGKQAEAHAAYEAALARIDAELAENPDDGDTVSRRAYALLGLGRNEEALEDAKRALDLVGDRFLTQQSIGRAYVALGRPAEAIEELTYARKKRASAPLASYTLARAYAALAAEALADAVKTPHFAEAAAADPLLRGLKR